MKRGKTSWTNYIPGSNGGQLRALWQPHLLANERVGLGDGQLCPADVALQHVALIPEHTGL